MKRKSAAIAGIGLLAVGLTTLSTGVASAQAGPGPTYNANCSAWNAQSLGGTAVEVKVCIENNTQQPLAHATTFVRLDSAAGPQNLNLTAQLAGPEAWVGGPSSWKVSNACGPVNVAVGQTVQCSTVNTVPGVPAGSYLVAYGTVSANGFGANATQWEAGPV
jgi:hypothetical protein